MEALPRVDMCRALTLVPWRRHSNVLTSKIARHLCLGLYFEDKRLFQSMQCHPCKCLACGCQIRGCAPLSRGLREGSQLSFQATRAANTDAPQQESGSQQREAKKTIKQQNTKGGKAAELKVTPRSEDFSRYTAFSLSATFYADGESFLTT